MANTTPVTLKFLANKLKMSVSTVSKALNDYHTINEYTKKRVKEMAEEWNFTPNRSAINLKNKKSHIIGVILPNLLDYFFTKSIHGIEQHAMESGYNIIIGQSFDEVEKEILLANMFLKSRVDGIIVAISKQTKNMKHLDQFENRGIPVIYYTRNPSFHLNCHKVLCNTFQGAYDATKLFIERGHTRIGYLGGPKLANFTHDRFKGYINALKDNGLPFDADLVAYSDFNKASTILSIQKLFDEKIKQPTALVAFKENILFDAIKYLKSVSYPSFKKLEFIGFGNTPFIDYLDCPPLASIEENPVLVGQNAIDLILKLIEKEISLKDYKKIVVNCKMILHDTPKLSIAKTIKPI